MANIYGDKIPKTIPIPQHFGEVITPDKPEDTIDPQFMDLYNDLASDKNNMSYWLPLVMLADCKDLRIPKTAIVPVPAEIMELFFMEKKGMTQNEMSEKVYEWVKNEFCPQAEAILGNGFWFLKNGSFSNKFDFSNCHTLSSNPMRMTQQILSINYTSLCFDAGGNTEMIAREYILPPDGTPCIYYGMPMRCEVRVFYDFDKHKPLYHVNYWDWDYCYNAIAKNPTDKIVYAHEYPRVKTRYEEVAPFVTHLVADRMANVTGLSGIWSIDVMENEKDQFYLIDMAIGQRSAYWNPDRIKE